MRRLLLALIVLSLSWTTIGYTCGMEGEVVRPACCCEAGEPRSCLIPASSCTHEVMAGEDEGCCSLIATAGIRTQGEAEAPTTPNILLTAPEAVRVARQIIPDIPISTRRSAHDRSTPSIYLLTGRLRR
jgi:hypothetical protein